MILGAILAGGESRRFGSDKAQATLAGTALLDLVVGALALQVDELVVCGRAWPGLRSLPDRPAPGLGPLAGLAAALHHAEACGFAQVLTLPCDTPLVDRGLIAALVTAGAPALVRDCPVIGIWPAALSPALDAHLEGADRSMRGWARRAGAAWLDLPAPANVNHAEDLAQLRDRARSA